MWTEPSPGERLAAALRRSPVHVDPSLAAALPAADRARLLAKMRAAPVPVYVVVVPLITGGTWSDAREMLEVVHDRLGRDGVYVTAGGDLNRLTARQWGGGADPYGDGGRHARKAANAIGLDPALRKAPPGTLLDRFLDLIIAGTGEQEYKRQSADLERRVRSRSASPIPGARGDDSAWPVVGGAAGLAVAGVAGLLLWRHRRMRVARPAGSALLLPRTVFTTAGHASQEELRAQASREVVAFGEALDAADVPGTAERPRELLTLALDAYQAAGTTLDAARGMPDLAGVLVLVDLGRDALASATSVAAGGPEIPLEPLCFFNPLHGDATVRVDWRPLGSRERLNVRACADCARAVKQRRTPDVLLDRTGPDPIPYFESDPAHSIWAATGYGQFATDLVPRILRGDLHR
ncbi:hypothetical protein [Actinomadura flavalba]|uniref:hypothetical protein n=1 Tax=Actinomadura flavalba TaxID=1120938 RepID=UPI00037512CF|nr:hypothetical protein [Actinomadura flavalba]